MTNALQIVPQDEFVVKWKAHTVPQTDDFKLTFEQEAQLSNQEKTVFQSVIPDFHLSLLTKSQFLDEVALKFAERGMPRFICKKMNDFAQTEIQYADLLRQFMKKNDFQLQKTGFIPELIQRAKNMPIIENAISMLLITEIFSLIIFDAISNTSSSLTLKRIGQNIFTEKLTQIRFQSEVIHQIDYPKKNVYRQFLYATYRNLSFQLYKNYIWLLYSPVLREGGFTKKTFSQAAQFHYKSFVLNQ